MEESSIAVMTSDADPRICEVDGKGLWLPLFRNHEQNWPRGLRIVLYIAGLGWCFLGVAIVSDIFMASIETITSKKVRKKDPVTQRYKTHVVWNATIANLSLMALGSSAPEILLSVIELFRNEMLAGELGPSTIVGSAAFNLLMIIAVCVSALPPGEVRFIKEVPVYVVTAMFSIFAYVWLIFILDVNTPHVVSIEEGVVTFLYFPVLLTLAYLADVGYFSKKEEPNRWSISKDMSKEELARVEQRIRSIHGQDITQEQLEKIIKIEARHSTTRAHYRVSAIRGLTGGKRVHVVDKSSRNRLSSLSMKHVMSGQSAAGQSWNSAWSSAWSNTKPATPRSSHTKVVPVPVPVHLEEVAEEPEKKVTFDFAALTYAVMENKGSVELTVTRSGETTVAASVSYRTREGTAKAKCDYEEAADTLLFSPGEISKNFLINIVNDNAYEEDEEFYVDLFDPSIRGGNGELVKESYCGAELGEIKTVTVVIIDDDLPGTIAFPADSLELEEGLQDREHEIVVVRKQGSTGSVTCDYDFEDATAVAPDDYEGVKGTLTFAPGVTSAAIKCKVKARGRYDRIERFRVILSHPTGGAKFDPECDGAPNACILTVLIKSHQMAKDRIDHVMSTLQANWSRAKLGSSNWREQFVQALYVNGGEDDDENEDESEPASYQDYVMHFVSLPWKLFFALVPPADYCGGWACFCCSLGMIGLVTAVIGDLAELLGCVVDLWPPEVTAITFVALGTSMPDTFASKSAATQDPFADASVGNVTGSNSVNVFLGLGLPWMIGSIYWACRQPSEEWLRKYQGDSQLDYMGTAFLHGENAYFVVKAGSLVPAVMIFSCCAICCIFILFVRRRLFGGELGGPKPAAIATSVLLMILWLAYVCLASFFAIREKNNRRE